MRYILILLLIATNSYSMSFQHAKQIYNRLMRANGYEIVPILKYNSTLEINASEGLGVITINQGMLLFVKNDNEMALVIGHEMGHYALGHSSSTPANEYAADKQGSIFMANAGYNICSGAKIFLRFVDGDDGTHPKSSLRYYRLCH